MNQYGHALLGLTATAAMLVAVGCRDINSRR